MFTADSHLELRLGLSALCNAQLDEMIKTSGLKSPFALTPASPIGWAFQSWLFLLIGLGIATGDQIRSAPLLFRKATLEAM